MEWWRFRGEHPNACTCVACTTRRKKTLPRILGRGAPRMWHQRLIYKGRWRFRGPRLGSMVWYLVGLAIIITVLLRILNLA